MINDTLKEAESKMDKAVEVTREDFAAIRTGRAHPQMFHKINADYYGSPTPLQQLASFTVPEARVIIIAPAVGDHAGCGMRLPQCSYDFKRRFAGNAQVHEHDRRVPRIDNLRDPIG